MTSDLKFLTSGSYGKIFINKKTNIITKECELFYLYEEESDSEESGCDSDCDSECSNKENKKHKYNSTKNVKHYVLDDTIKEICILSQLPNTFIPILHNIKNVQNEYNISIDMENCGITLLEYYISLTKEKQENMLPIIMYQLISAFYQQTLCGIIHCDIKYNNICVKVLEKNIKPDTDKIQIKIIDFGMSSLKYNNKYYYVNGNKLSKAPETIRYKEITEKSLSWTIMTVIMSLFIPNYNDIEQILTAFLTNHNFFFSNNFLDSIEEVIKKIIKVECMRKRTDFMKHLLAIKNRFSSLSPDLLELLKKMAYVDQKQRITLKELYEHNLFNDIAKEEVFPMVYKQVFNTNVLISEKYPINKINRKKNILEIIDHIKNFNFENYNTYNFKIISIATVIFDKYIIGAKYELKHLPIINLSCCIIANSLFRDLLIDVESLLFNMTDDFYSMDNLKNNIYNIIKFLSGNLYFNTFVDDLDKLEINIDNNKFTDTLIEVLPPYNNSKLLNYYIESNGL